MVYKKRSYRRRYRRRVYKKPLRYKVADMAYSAVKGVSYLKGLVNAELHHYDNITLGSSINNTGTIYHLNPIPVGDNNAERNGNSILSKYLFGRMEFVINGSSTYTFIRCIFFTDKQQIGDTSPGVTDVLSTASQTSPLNSFSAGRFKILKDMTIRLDTMHPSSNRKIMMKLPFHSKYNGTSGSDIQKNGLYLLVICNEPVNTPAFSYNLRYSFYDN